MQCPQSLHCTTLYPSVVWKLVIMFLNATIKNLLYKWHYKTFDNFCHLLVVVTILRLHYFLVYISCYFSLNKGGSALLEKMNLIQN